MKTWALVTPARNEADKIGALAESLMKQPPELIGGWIIVDDGSIDGTRKVAESFVMPFPIRVISKQNDGGLAGGSAFRSFFFGADAALEAWPNTALIMKLDADVILSADYLYEIDRCVGELESVGIVGGVATGLRDREQLDRVPGFIKGYTRKGFDVVREMTPHMGFDIVDESAVRLRGLDVRVVPTAHVRLSRHIGASEGIVRGRWRNGVVSRWSGYNPAYFALRLARYTFRRPIIGGAAAMLWGYMSAPRSPFPKAVRRQTAREHRGKLRELVRRPGGTLKGLYVLPKCSDPRCCD